MNYKINDKPATSKTLNILSQGRDGTLDILRAVGLLLIILAHCNPPPWLFQLRNFDVPLMVVVSAATFAFLYGDKTIDLKMFYKKRLAKLILPAWYFLTFFFASIFLYSYAVSAPYPFSGKDILSSYLFYSGIGYVWILRIFIMIAILTPPILYFKKRVSNNWIYAVLILAVYAAYEGLVMGLGHLNLPEFYYNLVTTVILPVLPFAVLYAYGIRIGELSSKYLALLAFIFLAIFMGFAIPLYIDHGSFLQTQIAKYPPTLYYLSYAMVMINVSVLILRTNIQSYLPQKMFAWLSMNSLWLYLWHIYGLYIWDHTISLSVGQLTQAGLKFIFVLSFAASLTALQNIACQRLFLKADKS